MKDEFVKLSTIYEAIKDLDRISKSDNDEKFDDAVNAIKNINRKEFDSDIQNRIINGIREALIKIYQENVNSLNTSINLSSIYWRPGVRDIDQNTATKSAVFNNIDKAAQAVVRDSRQREKNWN